MCHFNSVIKRLKRKISEWIYQLNFVILRFGIKGGRTLPSEPGYKILCTTRPVSYHKSSEFFHLQSFYFLQFFISIQILRTLELTHIETTWLLNLNIDQPQTCIHARQTRRQPYSIIWPFRFRKNFSLKLAGPEVKSWREKRKSPASKPPVIHICSDLTSSQVHERELQPLRLHRIRAAHLLLDHVFDLLPRSTPERNRTHHKQHATVIQTMTLNSILDLPSSLALPETQTWFTVVKFTSDLRQRWIISIASDFELSADFGRSSHSRNYHLNFAFESWVFHWLTMIPLSP